MKIVILAMLCSKPAETKANRHQKIRMHFAVSLRVFDVIHIARQSNQLQITARASNSVILLFIFEMNRGRTSARY